MRAAIRDTEIYFDIDGCGLAIEDGRLHQRPAAFLIHGGPGGDHVGFKRRFAALSGRMQLVYFDHRGQGRSARGDPARYTLDENVEDMEALRRQLGLGPIVSIGVSYGGMVALAHAARYPEAVSHLVPVVTVSHGGYAERAAQIVAARGTPEQVEQCAALFEGRIDSAAAYLAFLEAMHSLYSCEPGPPPANLSILEPEPLNRAHGPGGFLRDFDLRPELSRITAPTLVIGGRHDWICAPEFSEEIHRLIPGSELMIMENSAHMIGGPDLRDVLDAIRGFVVRRGLAAR